MADRPLAGTSRANGAVKTKLMVRFAGDLGSPSTAAGHAERAAGIHATAEEYCGFSQGILPYIGPDSAWGALERRLERSARCALTRLCGICSPDVGAARLFASHDLCVDERQASKVGEAAAGAQRARRVQGGPLERAADLGASTLRDGRLEHRLLVRGAEPQSCHARRGRVSRHGRRARMGRRLGALVALRLPRLSASTAVCRTAHMFDFALHACR